MDTLVFWKGSNTFALFYTECYGGKNVAYPEVCASIPKTSENKANAYDFIKLMLSETIQGNGIGSEGVNIPVLNQGRRDILKIMLQIQPGEWSTPDRPFANLTDEQADEVYDLLSDVKCVRYYSVDVGKKIWEDMLPYFEEEASYDECVKKLKSDLSIYVLE